MDILLHPTYFPSISQFVAIAQADTVTFEVDDNFQKQTNRNRMYIYSANGLQMLNIPVKHAIDLHQKFKDVRIENSFNWQKQHLKSLEASYRTSPYFEYFEDDIRPIFEKKHQFMMDLNFQILEILTDCLALPITYSKTEEYLKDPVQSIDLRHLVNGKKDDSKFEPYVQVFDDKYGFISNLSILDLLFNEGRHAVDYLRKQTLPLV